MKFINSINKCHNQLSTVKRTVKKFSKAEFCPGNNTKVSNTLVDGEWHYPTFKRV